MTQAPKLIKRPHLIACKTFEKSVYAADNLPSTLDWILSQRHCGTIKINVADGGVPVSVEWEHSHQHRPNL